ncbi:MaoC/PaaZ C-terminal domain-containing protein [Metabacillus arenae]|uniref:Enoyl-CoA hydratase n=1 Tax=Metabacillus arenae TaxID=2771434 RepID=A0A926S0K1_9BACI|nr:MaoC/PaaZ C-terminal domain-containing protein [Metabacillus arenae]MBD1380089.1 enoyl-CoA hydratase [Metabacillus arenae]
MLLGKKRKLGRQIGEITTGETLTLTEKIEDKDLLLYLGLTDDANPLYIQHNYASLTPYKKPVVPAIMLTGIICSAVSKYLPGPGSYILEQNLAFLKPIFHYTMVEYQFEVKEVDQDQNIIIIELVALNEQKEQVIKGSLTVQPPCQIECKDGDALDNF